MDSINKNQVEENKKDLNGNEATAKMKELIEKANSCFFCTEGGTGSSNGVRPMSVQKVDDEGNLWFLSANDSYKNKEISQNPAVKLYFQGSAHSDFLHFNGKASISEDKAKIKELWNPILKTWFTEGENDPRISVIKVVPNDGYYWDNKHGNAIAGIKMLIGAATGKTLDDSIEGKIKN
ncbi:MAG: pyridoxamine 5'-phosphate oxidase family protein [Verrucomicrobia bacterium]|nr:pyridoxamine 5'-phosphate oxidase family protein [Cytophagales bacterium]